MPETQAFTYDVFLSHSGTNNDVVRRLADRLRGCGLRVWFDEWEIRPGDLIPERIELGLESSRVLVLAISGDALRSGWVTLERGTFLFRDPTNEARRFIPLRLDDAEIPGMLKQLAYVDWRVPSDAAFEELLTACRSESPSDASPQFPQKPSPSRLLTALTLELRVALSEHLQTLRRLGPETPETEEQYIRARRDFLNGQDALLEELFDTTREYPPEAHDVNGLEIKYQVGMIFVEKRRAEDALTILSSLDDVLNDVMNAGRRTSNTELGRMFDGIGEAARFVGEYATARGWYEKANSLLPNNHFVLKHLGTIYRIGQEFQKAAESFRKALDVGETYHVHFSLGYTYTESGQYDMAKKHYQKCVQLLQSKHIDYFYRVYLKQAYVSLLESDLEAAKTHLRRALTSLACSSPDAFVDVSRFSASLLLATLAASQSARWEHMVRCEHYVRAQIDRISHPVFYRVYTDLDRVFSADRSALQQLLDRLAHTDGDLVRSFKMITHWLRLKHAQFIRQRANAELTVFPSLEKEISLYVKLLPGREDRVLRSARRFHRIQKATAGSPYSLKLTYEVIANDPSAAMRTVVDELPIMLDHAATIGLLKSDSIRFPFEASDWRPYTALVAYPLYQQAFEDYFAVEEERGGNRLIRVISLKILTWDFGKGGERIFINPTVGCSVGCPYCYLPQYGIRIDHDHGDLSGAQIDADLIRRAIERQKGRFTAGKGGTLLSIGSFCDPFITPLATLSLLQVLKSFGNPIQVATKVFPGNEGVLGDIVGLFAGQCDQLMINVSFNERSARLLNILERWLSYSTMLNVTVYVKPFLDFTLDCFDVLAECGRRHVSVSFVIGSLYFGRRSHLQRSQLRNHRPFAPLKSPVVPRPTTPGMKNVNEDQFRERLERAIGRTVFRTSSCSLAAKQGVADPLGNVNGPFCVAGCANREVCEAVSRKM